MALWQPVLLPERRAEEPKRASCGSFGLLRSAQELSRRGSFLKFGDSTAELDPAHRPVSLISPYRSSKGPRNKRRSTRMIEMPGFWRKSSRLPFRVLPFKQTVY